MQSVTVHAKPHRLVWLIGIGWLLGLAAQVATRFWSGYMDVSPPQLLLGALLCGASGAAAYRTSRGRRGPAEGALAGGALAASIVVGYAALAVLLWNPAWSEAGEQQWQGVVLEVSLAIAVALTLGAACGFVGWRLAARRNSGGATRGQHL